MSKPLHLPNKSFLQSYHVQIVLLPSGEAGKFLVNDTSTFEEVKEKLAASLKNPDGWTLLTANYGPIPCWTECTESRENSKIGAACQNLYAVNKNVPCVLGVVRTSEYDRPIAIPLLSTPSTDKPSPSTIRELVVAADHGLEGRIQSISPYSAPGDRDISEDPYTPPEEEESTLPTVFIINISPPPENFHLDVEVDSIPPFLQILFVKSKDLLQQAYGLKKYPLQMIHVSSALLHVVISLPGTSKTSSPSKTSWPSFDLVGGVKRLRDIAIEHNPGPLDEVTNKEGDPSIEDADMLQVVLLVADKLQKLHDDLMKILTDIQNYRSKQIAIQEEIDRIFNDLCGDYPGAVTVRHSHGTFETLATIDREQISRLEKNRIRLLGFVWSIFRRKKGNNMTPKIPAAGTSGRSEETPTVAKQDELVEGSDAIPVEIVRTAKERPGAILVDPAPDIRDSPVERVRMVEDHAATSVKGFDVGEEGPDPIPEKVTEGASRSIAKKSGNFIETARRPFKAPMMRRIVPAILTATSWAAPLMEFRGVAVEAADKGAVTNPVEAASDNTNVPLIVANLSSQTIARENTASDIERAISEYRTALETTIDGDSNKPILLNRLAICLESRFRCSDTVDDLQDAASNLQTAVDLTPDGHPAKPALLTNLGNVLQTRSARTGDLADLERAISSLKNAAELTPNDHPNKPSLLYGLGSMLLSRCQRLGNLDDLNQAISFEQTAVELTPDDYLDRHTLLNSVGNALRMRFERTGDLEDIERAIESLEIAANLTPDGHPEKPSRLSSLGAAFQSRFERLGNLTDREKSISFLEKAMELTPGSSASGQPINDGIYTITNAYHHRCVYLEDANDMTPLQGHYRLENSNARWHLRNYGKEQYSIENVDHNRYADSGPRAVINAHVEGNSRERLWCIQALPTGEYTIATTDTGNLWMLPDDEPGAPVELSDVYTDRRCWWSFNSAEAAAQADAVPTAEERLVVSRSEQDELSRGSDTIPVETVRAAKERPGASLVDPAPVTRDSPVETVRMVEEGHATTLVEGFDVGEEGPDPIPAEKVTEGASRSIAKNPGNIIETARSSFKAPMMRKIVPAILTATSWAAPLMEFRGVAVEAADKGAVTNPVETASDNTNVPLIMANLPPQTIAHENTPGDIERAISEYRTALETTIDGDSNKPMILNRLAICLESRFRRSDTVDDLQDAASNLQTAVDLTPDGHPAKPALLTNLGNVLQTHSARTGDLTEVDKAISSLKNAAELTPDGHPNKPSLLYSLGSMLLSRFQRLGNLDDVNQAISFKQTAVELTPDGYLDRHTLLNSVGKVLQMRFERTGDLEDIERAIASLEIAADLTPDGHPEQSSRLSSLGAAFQSRFERLGNLADREKSISFLEKAVELTPSAAEDFHILQRLEPVNAPSYREDHGCMEGTRTALLDHLVAWTLKPTSQESLTNGSNAANMYWLHGSPGLGKTSIANSLCDRLHGIRTLGGSFFCRRDDPIMREPRRILPTLISKLAQLWDPYRKLVVQALQDDPQLNPQSKGGEVLFSLLQSVQKHPPHTLVLVIDALDECGDPLARKSLLTCLLEGCSRVSWIKIIITSRQEHDIKIFFERNLVGSRDLANDDQTLDDICLFTRQRMSTIASSHHLPPDWPGEERLKQIVDRSGGLFIFVETVCRYVDDPDPDPLLAEVLDGELVEANAELHKLYSMAILSRIGRSKEKFRSFAQAVVVVETYRPLPEETLGSLMGLNPHLVRSWVDGLSSILYRDASTNGGIRVRHSSVIAFLTGPSCPEEFRVVHAEANEELGVRCLTTMMKELKFNICELETSCVLNADISDLDNRVQIKISDALQYSSMYWSNHLCSDSAPASIATSELLDAFLGGTQLLHWVEVMSLMGKVPVGVSSMRLMKSCFKKFEDRHQHPVEDALRFLLAFLAPISASTPHIYVSALPFTPMESDLWKHASVSFPEMINVYNGRAESWPAPSSIWPGHTDYVRSVAYSPDGRNVISGSSDHTIRIWDAQTGAAVGQPLAGHSRTVWSVAYSPDGRNIVSGSDDNTIRIWDAQTGVAVGQPLAGHSGTVWSVAYSPDGRNIASGSFDNTIRMWDAQTGAAVGQPLAGHSGTVWSVAYSPDGRNIASGSFDNTIRMWNAQTGSAVGQPLTGHSDYVRSVAYSPDGRNIISGSFDNTIRMWDAQTGAAVGQPLAGHSGTVWSVAYSPDGRNIASGSDDNTIRIWDAQTGAAVDEPLTGHTGPIFSVAYSPDGRNVISGSSDRTIRVWDTQAGMDEDHRVVSHPSHLSTNQLYLTAFSGRPIPATLLDPDGWVRSAEGLLFWVPEDCRSGLTCPAIMTIPNTGRERSVRIDFTRFQYGTSWTTIRGGIWGADHSSISSV